MTVTSAKEYQQPTFIASRGVRNITPADVDLTDVALQLYVTTGGTLVITGLDGVTTTITVPNGYTHPSIVVRIASTSTASGIIAYV